jgi:hypothetical protein
MASSFSDLGIELMATGENAGTWGTKTNTNLQIIEKSIAGYVEQAVTSGGTTALSITDGDTTESTSVARHAVIKLTGTITGNSIVTVPDSIEKVYIVTNGTSGAYTVQFKTASGTGITFGVSEKTTRLVYSDGTNIVDAGFSGASDLEGRELVLDADGDTTITADTDDQIDIKIAGADDFQFTANTFTAQSGSTIAAQALTATTITASGIVKTDDTTEATSTTDGSLQTDGGLSVAKDTVIGDDLKLLSDSAVLSFGADSDTTLTHTDGTGLTLNSTNKLLFGDTGTYIHQSADGVLDLVSDTEIEINATTIDINGAVAMDGAITGATNITLSGELDAATLDISGNADIDGTTNLDAVDIDGAVQLDATLTVGVDDQGYDVKLFGDTASAYMLWDTSADDLILGGAAGLIVPDGQFTLGSTAVTSTGSELNLLDGGTSVGSSITLADGDGVVTNDGGTMKTIPASDIKTYVGSAAGAFSIANLDIDGGTDIGAGIADADLFIVDDGAGGTNRKVAASRLKTYIGSGVAADDISVGDAAVTLSTSSGDITIDATANDSDIIFKGTDATADITMLTLDGSDAGTATFNHDIILGNDSFIQFGGASETISGDGTDMTIAANNLTIDAAADIILDAAGNDFNFKAGGTEVLRITNSSSDVIIRPVVDAKDIIFQQRDGTEVARIEDNATFNVSSAGKFAYAGTAVTSTAAELNILDGVTATATELNYSDLATLGTSAASKVLSADANNLTKITGAIYIEEATLTFDATQDWDVRASPVAKVTLTNNVTFDAPTNPTTGQFISIVCIQDGTGSRTIAWNAVFEFASDTAPTATTTASKADMFNFRYNGSKWLEVGRNLALTVS